MTIASKKPSPTLAPVAFASPDAVKAFETAAAPVREIQENVRKATEKGFEQSREAYARVKTAAEDATHSIETSYASATKGIVAINTKAIDALRANADAAFDLYKSLLGVKSVSEAITLQSEHARKQFEAVTFQGKEISSLAQKVAADSFEPLRATFGKTFTAGK